MRGLGLLGLKWKREPEACHDYLLFLKRDGESGDVATASSKGYVDSVTEIWDARERRMRWRLETPNAGTMALSWLSPSVFLTSGHDCHLSLWQDNTLLNR